MLCVCVRDVIDVVFSVNIDEKLKWTNHISYIKFVIYMSRKVFKIIVFTTVITVFLISIFSYSFIRSLGQNLISIFYNLKRFQHSSLQN